MKRFLQFLTTGEQHYEKNYYNDLYKGKAIPEEINKRVNVALALISLSFKTKLLIGGDTDILYHVILLTQRTQKFLSWLVFQP